jgi:hypothetical protein
MSSNFHGAPLKMELDGKIMTLDLQLHMCALRVILRSLARHSPNGSPKWQLREWNSLKHGGVEVWFSQNLLAIHKWIHKWIHMVWSIARPRTVNGQTIEDRLQKN